MKAHRLAMFTVAGFAIASACHVTPKQAGEGTRALCTLVEALADSAIVESVCATAPELAQLAALVRDARADAGVDAGARTTSVCQVIPQTTTCATNAERLAALRALKKSRVSP